MGALKITGALIAKNSLLSFLGQIVPIIIGVTATPFIVQRLGPERFGLLSLAWVFLGYFTFFDLGVGRATTKHVAEALGRGKESQIPSLVWTAVAIQALFGAVGTLLLAALTPLLVERILRISPGLIDEAKDMFILLALTIPIVLISGSLAGVLEAFQRFDLVNVVKPLSLSVAFIIPLLAGTELHLIVGSVLSLRIVVLFAYMLACFRIAPVLTSNVSINPSLIPVLIAYGGWISVTSMVSLLLDRVDLFFIGSILTTSKITYYSIPQEALAKLWIIPYSLTIVLFPTFAVLHTHTTRIAAIYVKSLTFVATLTLPITCGIILFSRELLNFWIGGSFAEESAIVTQIMAAGSTIAILSPIPATALQSLGRPDIVSKILLIQLPFYPIICYLAISIAGLEGAAIILAFRAIIQTSMMLWSANQQISVSHQECIAIRKMLVLALASVLIAIILSNFGPLILRIAFESIIALISAKILLGQREIRSLIMTLTAIGAKTP